MGLNPVSDILKRADRALKSVDGTLGHVDTKLSAVDHTVGRVDVKLSSVEQTLRPHVVSDTLDQVRDLLTELESELALLQRVPEIVAKLDEIGAALESRRSAER